MSTLIICPACQTRYEIAAALPPEGRKVRCSKCNHVWQATAVASEPEPAAPTPRAAEPPPVPAPQAPQASQSEARAAPAAVNPAFRGFAGIARPRQEPVFGPPPPPVPEPQVKPAPEASYSEPPPQPAVKDAEFDIGDFEADLIDFDMDVPAPHLNGPGVPVPALSGGTPVPAFEEFSFGSMSDAAMGAEPAAPAVKQRKPRSGGKMGWALLALFLAMLAGLFLLAPRSVVSMLPGAARLYAMLGMPVNMRGLAIEGVHYNWQADGGLTLLKVEGEIVNVTSSSADVPVVVISLEDAAGQSLAQWTTKVQGEQLAAGERAPFAAEIPSPPENARSIKVRFAKAE